MLADEKLTGATVACIDVKTGIFARVFEGRIWLSQGWQNMGQSRVTPDWQRTVRDETEVVSVAIACDNQELWRFVASCSMLQIVVLSVLHDMRPARFDKTSGKWLPIADSRGEQFKVGSISVSSSQYVTCVSNGMGVPMMLSGDRTKFEAVKGAPVGSFFAVGTEGNKWWAVCLILCCRVLSNSTLSKCNAGESKWQTIKVPIEEKKGVTLTELSVRDDANVVVGDSTGATWLYVKDNPLLKDFGSEWRKLPENRATSVAIDGNGFVVIAAKQDDKESAKKHKGTVATWPDLNSLA